MTRPPWTTNDASLAGWSQGSEGDGGAQPGGAGEVERYRRDGLVGAGGMGRVYLARDNVLGRAVALKEAASDGEHAERLQREAKLTASLEHPGIVTVHDAGQTEDGRPFYTMRLVRGRALSELMDRDARAPTRLRLIRHFLAACHALAYAHSLGVIHRDIKPANIMIGAFGETQVVDWGLACMSGEPSVSAIGTPSYMSPEAARGGVLDARVDVWGLGAVLFELLSGASPWGKGPSAELIQRAQQDERPRILKLVPELELDLAAIVDHALERDPAKRYPNAGAMAEDVAAWLDGRPVSVYHYRRRDRLVRALKASQSVLAVVIPAVALLVAAGIYGSRSLGIEHARSVAAEKDSMTFFASALAAQAALAARDGALPLAQLLAAESLLREERPEARGVLAQTILQSGLRRTAIWPTPSCRFIQVIGTDDQICATSDEVFRQAHGEMVWTVPFEARALNVGADRLMVLGDQRSLVLDLETGGELTQARCCLGPVAVSGDLNVELHPQRVDVFAQSPTQTWPGWMPCGPQLRATVMNLFPGGHEVLALCDDGRLARGRPGAPMTWRSKVSLDPILEQAAYRLFLSRDGDMAVVAGTRGGLVKVDLQTEEVVYQDPIHPDLPERLIFSDDGKLLAVLSERGVVNVYCTEHLRLIGELPLRGVEDIRFLEGRTLLAVTREQGSQWEIGKQEQRAVLRTPLGVTDVVFSEDGSHLLSSHSEGQVRSWDVTTGDPVRQISVGRGVVKAIDTMPGGSDLFLSYVSRAPEAAPPGLYRVAADGVASLVAEQPTRDLAMLSGGDILIAKYMGQEYLVRDGVPLRDETHGCPKAIMRSASSSPDGKWGILVGNDGDMAIYDSAAHRCSRVIRGKSGLVADILGDGSRVVAGIPGGVLVMDQDGRELWSAVDGAFLPLDVAYSPDGRWVAAGGADHTGRIWDARTGELRAVLSGSEERVSSVAFNPSSTLLATGSWDGSVRLWSLSVMDLNPQTVVDRAKYMWGIELEDALAQVLH